MITGTSNERVKQVVQWQKKAGERGQAGIFLAEGIKMFREAPAEWLREVYVSEECLERLRADHVLWRKLLGVGFETVADHVFRKMSDTLSPQGILAVLERPKYRLEDLLAQENPLFVFLEDLQDPGNVGTIMRTGEGAGVTGLILAGETADLFNPKTVRATMGSVFRVPFVRTEDVRQTVSLLKKSGVRLYAAHLRGERYYTDLSYKGPSAFMIGSEGKGLREETAYLADCYLKIPMEGRVESLNAAVAASLLLYEAHRQRH